MGFLTDQEIKGQSYNANKILGQIAQQQATLITYSYEVQQKLLIQIVNQQQQILEELKKLNSK